MDSQLVSTDNIVCHSVLLGEGAKGFVYQSKRGKYHIFINDSLSHDAALEVFYHEMHHIKNDLPKMPYIIGIDMQGEEFEKNANLFAHMKIISTLI
jgi:hypothetical protein